MSLRWTLTPRVKRLSLMALVLALAAGFVAMRLSPGDGAPISPPPPPDPMVYPEGTGARDPLALLGGGAAESGGLFTPTGARPMRGAPGDLPIYEGARRWLGFERVGPRWVEQTGVWSIGDVDARRVAAFYAEEAERAGYKPRRIAEPPLNHTRWYVRDGRVLMVRVREEGRSVRLTLILRYTRPDPAPGSSGPQ